MLTHADPSVSCADKVTSAPRKGVKRDYNLKRQTVWWEGDLAVIGRRRSPVCVLKNGASPAPDRGLNGRVGGEVQRLRTSSASPVRIHPDAAAGSVPSLVLRRSAVYASGAKTVRIAGGAHLSVALALGAALPETKIGVLEALDLRDQVWTSMVGDKFSTNDVHIEPIDIKRPSTAGRDRIAVFVRLTPDDDGAAFERLIRESTDGFTAAAIVSTDPNSRIDAREAGRLSTAVARAIKGLSGRAEIHLAFHGPYTMAALTGRYLNTLRIVIYEWKARPPTGRPTHR